MCGGQSLSQNKHPHQGPDYPVGIYFAIMAIWLYRMSIMYNLYMYGLLFLQNNNQFLLAGGVLLCTFLVMKGTSFRGLKASPACEWRTVTLDGVMTGPSVEVCRFLKASAIFFPPKYYISQNSLLFKSKKNKINYLNVFSRSLMLALIWLPCTKWNFGFTHTYTHAHTFSPPF